MHNVYTFNVRLKKQQHYELICISIYARISLAQYWAAVKSGGGITLNKNKINTNPANFLIKSNNSELC